jgi:Flp pilus assembly pilin Flp
MLHTIKSLILDDRGATLVEYGLLAGLVAVVAFVSVGVFGRHVRLLFLESHPSFHVSM